MKKQGLDSENNVLYQDNKSAILLEINGFRSKGKRSKHMHHMFFFIKDKIDNDGLKVKWCNTEEMKADFLTKPLQGSKFLYLREFIMNQEKMNVDINVEYLQACLTGLYWNMCYNCSLV